MSKSSKSNAPALSVEAPLPSSQQAPQMKKRRLEEKREMEISTEKRNWDELIPDALGIIFKDLSLKEKLTVVPSVCKSWGRAVCSPICWQEIDLQQCSNGRSSKKIDLQQCSNGRSSEKIDQLLRMLVIRSCGSLSKLVYNQFCTDDLFSFIANNASSLQTLIIQENNISDGVVEQVANRLTNITTLDLSNSYKIGPKGLEAFGNNCKNLTVLHYSRKLWQQLLIANDKTAFAIASTMPNLRCLEVPYFVLTNNDGLLEIISKCKKLESLNILGRWKATPEQELLMEKYPNLKVLFDREEDSAYNHHFDDCDIFFSSDDDSAYERNYIMAALGLL